LVVISAEPGVLAVLSETTEVDQRPLNRAKEGDIKEEDEADGDDEHRKANGKNYQPVYIASLFLAGQ